MKGQKQLFSKDTDEWHTPSYVFDAFNDLYNFEIDLAATKENTLCPKFYSKEDSALEPHNHWNKNAWCNPPYSKCSQFIQKAIEQHKKNQKFYVFLLPVRTCSKWFEKLWESNVVMNFYFITGRLKFSNAPSSAPFPSLIVNFIPNDSVMHKRVNNKLLRKKVTFIRREELGGPKNR